MFSRTDTVTDSDRFYNSILELFDDIEEQEEVRELIEWWNRYVRWELADIRNINLMRYRQIFPNYISTRRPLPMNSALAKIKERRAAKRAAQNNPTPQLTPAQTNPLAQPQATASNFN